MVELGLVVYTVWSGFFCLWIVLAEIRAYRIISGVLDSGDAYFVHFKLIWPRSPTVFVVFDRIAKHTNGKKTDQVVARDGQVQLFGGNLFGWLVQV